MTWYPYEVDRCPECGGSAVYALDKAGEEIYLDPETVGGDMAALDDPNRIAWCRPAKPGTQLELGEYLVSLHVCPLAVVLPFGSRPRMDRPEKRRRYA